MNKINLALTLITLVIAAPAAMAGHKGAPTFSDEDRSRHEEGLDKILVTAATCLQRDLDHHKEFYDRFGISAFYGDRSAFGKLSYSGKKNYLRSLGFNSSLVAQMEPTSCVGLTLKCLGEGFRAAGQDDLWKRLREYTMNNDVDGTALQDGLQRLGWKILYWNPDTRMNREWDRQERAKDPANKTKFWGFHEENWGVAKRGRYLYNKVDDARALVDFGTQEPEFLKEVPFFVGTAHGGYHVFPGFYGNVVEAHSTRKITDPKTLQAAPFNPLAGEAPTDGEYKSGLIAIPGKFLR